MPEKPKLHVHADTQEYDKTQFIGPTNPIKHASAQYFEESSDSNIVVPLPRSPKTALDLSSTRFIIS